MSKLESIDISIEKLAVCLLILFDIFGMSFFSLWNKKREQKIHIWIMIYEYRRNKIFLESLKDDLDGRNLFEKFKNEFNEFNKYFIK